MLKFCSPTKDRLQYMVNPTSKAATQGIKEGFEIVNINNCPTKLLTKSEAHSLLRQSKGKLRLELARKSSDLSRQLYLKSQDQFIAGSEHSPNTLSSYNYPTFSRKDNIQSANIEQIRREKSALMKCMKSDVILRKKINKSTNTVITSNCNAFSSDQNIINCINKPSQKKKQLKFALHRRSLSESDLLNEIDNELVIAKDFLFARGIWSPNNKSEPLKQTGAEEKLSKTPTSPPPPPPPPPIWTPKSAEPSPTFDRKEFKPVKFESPILQRKNKQEESKENVTTSPPWSYTNTEQFRLPNSKSTSSNVNSNQNLPKIQSPTVTLLQKAREDHLPKGPITYMDKEQYRISSQNLPLRPARANETFQNIKNDYLSDFESDREPYRRLKNMAEIQHNRKYEGVGPTTKDGMPIILRSEIDENNHHKWYKKMYNTLHKVRDEDDYVTVRYKTRRGRYPYKANGYMSEPEPNYDSDYSVVKYNTLDRRRIPSTGSSNYYTDDKSYGTMPNPIKSGSGMYKNQPGKIEHYIPGHSSVSDKERKEHLDHQKMANRNYTEGYLSRALKEQGYESDSTLVFRKNNNSQYSPLSPIEQKQAYLNVQSGGEPPLHGFRKAAPEKPKESPYRYVEGDVNIHYRSPIRYEYKDPMSESELAYRSAEQMKKLYQEERRRKYINELQDMNNRRHTDYFTASEKSPISLNRYDDFGSDIQTTSSVKSPTSSTVASRTVAKALFNFQGQSARELSFKKGDIIYIRREIDKNWYEGEHNAMIGLLPSNYVEIISKDGVRMPAKKPAEGQARAKFNFQAQSAIELSLNKGELITLTRRVDDNWFEGKIANRKGIFPVSYVDVLTDIGNVENTPILPSKPIGAPAAHSLITTPTTPSSNDYRPNFPSDLTNGNDIGNLNGGTIREAKTLHKTEELHVNTDSEPIAYRAIYKYRPQNIDELELQEGDTVYVLEKCDDGWFVGTSQRTGYFGTFPGNYVEKL